MTADDNATDRAQVAAQNANPSPAQPAAQGEQAKIDPTALAANKTNINFSGGLPGFLKSQDISLAFTSYQTGRLYLAGHSDEGKLALHEATYPQAMGVAGDGQRIYLGTLLQLVRLENVLAPGQRANKVHDKVFVPRNMQTFGNIDFHEVGVRENGVVVVVNTKYSCLCEPSLTHSFKPIWKPPFISKLAPEDRCHLNGLAMKDGAPKYVTAICKSDVVDGWRDRRHEGGLIIDVETDEIVIEGLSMPHSPRWHDGKLWVLNSGTGELGWIEEGGAFRPLAFCPGFLRGLTFFGGYAAVGLSKPRHGRFEGLALDEKIREKDADPWCGIQIISLATGDVVQWLRFDGAIAELFDICALPGVQNAITLGPNSPEIRDFVTFEMPATP